MNSPQVIANRFEIADLQADLLGQGGMGSVYRDTHTGQPVAVKALLPDLVARVPDVVARFTREGEALRQLNHPNIVNMVAAMEQDGQHHLIMEYWARPAWPWRPRRRSCPTMSTASTLPLAPLQSAAAIVPGGRGGPAPDHRGGSTAARERGQARDLAATVRELLAELESVDPSSQTQEA